jgi:hypothetical protein
VHWLKLSGKQALSPSQDNHEVVVDVGGDRIALSFPSA